METLRFGICGTGAFGRTRAKALQQTGGAEVTLGWSRTQRTRDTFRQELNAPTVEHWQQLCESPDVDAVLVCSTDVDHFPHARAALAAGKHVLVEIPLCLHADQARELAQLAAAKSMVLHHGLQWRYHPGYPRQIEQIRRIGPLLHGIEHAYWDFGPQRMWMADPAFNAGGRDFLAFYMPRWLEAFGEVKRVTGTQSRTESWAAATITMDFAAGGYITVSYTLGAGIWSRPFHLIVGSNGMICQNNDGNSTLITTDAEQPFDLHPADGVQHECEAFRDEILGLRDHRTPLDHDLSALELVDEAMAPDA